MTHEEFGQWVNGHVAGTGADTVRVTDLLWANRDIICDEWQATYAEMCECTDRLVEKARVPQFPPEHTNALHVELKMLRAEERRKLPRRDAIYAGRYSLSGHDHGCLCPACHGGEILPEFERQQAACEAALRRLQDYIVANGGTLTADRRE